MTSMSMSKSVPTPTLMCPEIDPSELKAVRDFLTSIRQGDESAAGSRPAARPFARPGPSRKAPAVSNGITRARFRSAPKATD